MWPAAWVLVVWLGLVALAADGCVADGLCLFCVWFLSDAWALGWRVFFGACWLGVWVLDEPESLILAQSERWRHA